MGQPSQNGPLTVQPTRSLPPDIKKPPFVVPTSNRDSVLVHRDWAANDPQLAAMMNWSNQPQAGPFLFRWEP
jgi:hypothetical protein